LAFLFLFHLCPRASGHLILIFPTTYSLTLRVSLADIVGFSAPSTGSGTFSFLHRSVPFIRSSRPRFSSDRLVFLGSQRDERTDERTNERTHTSSFWPRRGRIKRLWQASAYPFGPRATRFSLWRLRSQPSPPCEKAGWLYHMHVCETHDLIQASSSGTACRSRATNERLAFSFVFGPLRFLAGTIAGLRLPIQPPSRSLPPLSAQLSTFAAMR
jgi:hypothetical protein